MLWTPAAQHLQNHWVQAQPSLEAPYVTRELAISTKELQIEPGQFGPAVRYLCNWLNNEWAFEDSILTSICEFNRGLKDWHAHSREVEGGLHHLGAWIWEAWVLRRPRSWLWVSSPAKMCVQICLQTLAKWSANCKSISSPAIWQGSRHRSQVGNCAEVCYLRGTTNSEKSMTAVGDFKHLDYAW